MTRLQIVRTLYHTGVVLQWGHKTHGFYPLRFIGRLIIGEAARRRRTEIMDFEKRFDDSGELMEFLGNYLSTVGGFDAWVGWCPQECSDSGPWLLKIRGYISPEDVEKAREELTEQARDEEESHDR